MAGDQQIRAEATAQGLRTKRHNALTAAAFGGLLVAASALLFPTTPTGSVLGFVLGLLYANAFEYCLHRFLLHSRLGLLAQKHNLHHESWGAPNEARYINFARSPWVVVLLFSLNAIPVVAIEQAFRWGIAPGALAAFVAYFVVYEEVHWRLHLDTGLPAWLASARRHHFQHHAGVEERFNVFLPLWDWISARMKM